MLQISGDSVQVQVLHFLFIESLKNGKIWSCDCSIIRNLLFFLVCSSSITSLASDVQIDVQTIGSMRRKPKLWLSLQLWKPMATSDHKITAHPQSVQEITKCIKMYQNVSKMYRHIHFRWEKWDTSSDGTELEVSSLSWASPRRPPRQPQTVAPVAPVPALLSLHWEDPDRPTWPGAWHENRGETGRKPIGNGSGNGWETGWTRVGNGFPSGFL